MRINPISVTYANQPARAKRASLKTDLPAPQTSEPAFKGKHTCAKGLAAIFGALGTAGAVGGILIMTGGLAAPALGMIAAYGGLSAASGAIIGHEIDKGAKEEEENEKANKK